MTIQELKIRIKAIEAASDDDEVAHRMEDELFRAVLKAIADGAAHGPALAAMVLETDDIQFARHCA